MRPRHHLAWTAALALAAVSRIADGTEIRTLTAQRAVELALQGNPAVRAQGLAVAVARANEVTAGLRPNPVFVSSAQDFTAGLSQLFERGGKRHRRIESARLSTEIAGSDLSDARRNLVASVRKTFVNALLAQSNLELARDNLANFQQVEDVNRLRFQKGDISGADLLKIELQKLQFQTDAAEAMLALKTAKAALRALLATPNLAEEFEIEGTLGYREFDVSLAELKAIARRERPDLRSSELLKQKTEADIRLALANSYADISLTIGYHHTEPRLPAWINPLVPAGPAEDSIGLGVSFPIRIFDRNQGEIARTRAEAARAAALAEALQHAVVNEVEVAYAAVRASRDRIRLYEEIYLKRARESREIAEFAYRSGATSVLDLLEAERTYRGVQLAYHQVLATHLTNLYQLNAAVGVDVVK